MKKTLLIYALIVALLIATISLAVSANVGKLDSNGKVMGDPTPFINDQNRITEIKEEKHG